MSLIYRCNCEEAWCAYCWQPGRVKVKLRPSYAEVVNEVGSRAFYHRGKIVCTLPPMPNGLQISKYVYEKWKVTHATP